MLRRRSSQATPDDAPPFVVAPAHGALSLSLLLSFPLVLPRRKDGHHKEKRRAFSPIWPRLLFSDASESGHHEHMTPPPQTFFFPRRQSARQADIGRCFCRHKKKPEKGGQRGRRPPEKKMSPAERPCRHAPFLTKKNKGKRKKENFDLLVSVASFLCWRSPRLCLFPPLDFIFNRKRRHNNAAIIAFCPAERRCFCPFLSPFFLPAASMQARGKRTKPAVHWRTSNQKAQKKYERSHWLYETNKGAEKGANTQVFILNRPLAVQPHGLDLFFPRHRRYNRRRWPPNFHQSPDKTGKKKDERTC